MRSYRTSEVAELLGISPETVRRWCDDGRLATSRTDRGDRVIDGADGARFTTRMVQLFSDPIRLLMET